MVTAVRHEILDSAVAVVVLHGNGLHVKPLQIDGAQQVVFAAFGIQAQEIDRADVVRAQQRVDFVTRDRHEAFPSAVRAHGLANTIDMAGGKRIQPSTELASRTVDGKETRGAVRDSRTALDTDAAPVGRQSLIRFRIRFNTQARPSPFRFKIIAIAYGHAIVSADVHEGTGPPAPEDALVHELILAELAAI